RFEEAGSAVGACQVRGRTPGVFERADHERAVRPPLRAPLRAGDRPALLVVRRSARMVEEDGADEQRLPPQQPVYLPGNGEAFSLLRDDAARPQGARDLADPQQAAPPQPALHADGLALQPRL